APSGRDGSSPPSEDQSGEQCAGTDAEDSLHHPSHQKTTVHALLRDEFLDEAVRWEARRCRLLQGRSASTARRLCGKPETRCRPRTAAHCRFHDSGCKKAYSTCPAPWTYA